MAQRTAIVLDEGDMFAHQTPDEERDEILRDLTRLGLEPELVHYGHNPLELPATQIDLLCVDYGALWQLDMGDWTRGLLTWADEHPGSLVVLWSGMTADFFVREMGGWSELYGEKVEGREAWPANVRALHSGNSYTAMAHGDPLKWREKDVTREWYDKSNDVIRAWFGITGETAIEREVREAGPLIPPED